MYDLNFCLDCGLPFEPVQWTEDLSGIGDDSSECVTYRDDEVCECTREDEDD